MIKPTKPGFIALIGAVCTLLLTALLTSIPPLNDQDALVAAVVAIVVMGVSVLIGVKIGHKK